MSYLKKKKYRIHLDYSDFIKLDVYLLYHIEMGVKSIERNCVVWMIWNDFYIARDIRHNMIRKGSLRESDTIYIYDKLTDTSKWNEQPDDDLIKMIEEAIDYWDLNIG